jgi:hypothetical protein
MYLEGLPQSSHVDFMQELGQSSHQVVEHQIVIIITSMCAAQNAAKRHHAA